MLLALVAEGKVERSMNVIHVVITKLEDLTHALQGLAGQSRDFR